MIAFIKRSHSVDLDTSLRPPPYWAFFGPMASLGVKLRTDVTCGDLTHLRLLQDTGHLAVFSSWPPPPPLEAVVVVLSSLHLLWWRWRYQTEPSCLAFRSMFVRLYWIVADHMVHGGYSCHDLWRLHACRPIGDTEPPPHNRHGFDWWWWWCCVTNNIQGGRGRGYMCCIMCVPPLSFPSAVSSLDIDGLWQIMMYAIRRFHVV